MVSVRINDQEHKLEEVDESWVNQQINRRRRENQAVCVIVTVHTDHLHMTLSTPTCAGSGGGGRDPNPSEQEVIGLWAKLHLNTNDFSGGNLIAFLKQLRKMI